MLNRSHRLSVEQLNTVLEKGRAFSSPLFLIRVLGGQKSTRIAAVAPKKIARTAVARHRITRAIYGAVESIPGIFSGTTHIVIFAKNDHKAAPPDNIKDELKSVFVKAGLLR